MDDAFDYGLTEYGDDSYGGLTGAETAPAAIAPTRLAVGGPETRPYVQTGWPEERRV